MLGVAQRGDQVKRAYMQVADAIRADIAAGRLQPGDKLPSIRGLAAHHRVAQVTARNAVRLLADQGVAYVDTTRGYFVAKPSRPRRAAPAHSGHDSNADQLQSFGRELEQIKERLAKVEGSIQELHEPRRASRDR